MMACSLVELDSSYLQSNEWVLVKTVLFVGYTLVDGLRNGVGCETFVFLS